MTPESLITRANNNSLCFTGQNTTSHKTDISLIEQMSCSGRRSTTNYRIGKTPTWNNSTPSRDFPRRTKNDPLGYDQYKRSICNQQARPFQPSNKSSPYKLCKLTTISPTTRSAASITKTRPSRMTRAVVGHIL